MIYHFPGLCMKSREAIVAVDPSKRPLSLHVSTWLYLKTKPCCLLPTLGRDREEGGIESGGIPIHEVASP